jgi:hypothetical protein
VTPEVLDASRDVAADQLVVLLRDRKDGTDCWLPDDVHERLPGASLRVRARLDPKTARLGRPIPRRSELGVDGWRAGWPFTVMLRVGDEVLAQAGPPKRVGSRVLTLSRGRHGPLSITAVRVPKPKAPPPPPRPPTPGWKRVARGVRRRLRRLQGSGSKG